MKGTLLRYEALEPRLVMSGNVIVQISGQYPVYDLKVTGDAQGNQITISSDAAGSVWTVAGIPGSGTTVNGRPSVTVGGVTNSVWIDMKGGNDVVKLLSFHVPNELHVDLDAGDDLLEAGLVSTGTNANVVGGEMWVVGDDGSDAVSLANLSARDNLWAKLGDGSDRLQTWSTQVDGYFRIHADAGNQWVALTDVRAENVIVALGEGNDTFRAERVEVRQRLVVNAMRGDDVARLYYCVAAEADLSGGVGYDRLYLGANRFGRLSLYGWEYIANEVPALTSSKTSR